MHGRSPYLNKVSFFVVFLGRWHGDLPGSPPSVCVFVGLSSLSFPCYFSPFPVLSISSVELYGLDQETDYWPMPTRNPNHVLDVLMNLWDNDPGLD